MNLYDILGIKKDATLSDIKKAYHNKAKESHPDKPDGDTDSMSAVNNAYAILKDPRKRKTYDKDGEEAAQSTRQERALSYAMQISKELVERNPPDIKASVNHLISSWKNAYTIGRRTKESKKKTLIEFKKRIVDAPPRDVLTMVIDQAIASIDDEIKGIDEDFEDRMEGCKIIDRYTFADIEQDTPVYSGTSVNGFYATT